MIQRLGGGGGGIFGSLITKRIFVIKKNRFLVANSKKIAEVFCQTFQTTKLTPKKPSQLAMYF